MKEEGKRMEKKANQVKYGDNKPIRRLTYPRIDDVSPKTLDFFGTKRNVVTFLSEIVKQGGEMLAAEALGYDWWDVDGLLEADPAFRNLVDHQRLLIGRKAEEILCNRAMHGFEEVVEERGEIVKKSRKFNDRALLDYLKANNPKYKKDAPEDSMPDIEIRRFEVPAKAITSLLPEAASK